MKLIFTLLLSLFGQRSWILICEAITLIFALVLFFNLLFLGEARSFLVMWGKRLRLLFFCNQILSQGFRVFKLQSLELYFSGEVEFPTCPMPYPIENWAWLCPKLWWAENKRRLLFADVIVSFSLHLAKIPLNFLRLVIYTGLILSYALIFSMIDIWLILMER
jgi:hypothetical protein